MSTHLKLKPDLSRIFAGLSDNRASIGRREIRYKDREAEPLFDRVDSNHRPF